MNEDQSKDEQVDQDHFSRIMFGSRKRAEENVHPKNDTSAQPSINFEEIMRNIDTLMDSAKHFKPLFQKVLPIVERIWKNK